jgi:hypothetical protein
MTTTIKGNLILEKDTVFDEGIVVKGSILGKDGLRYDLKVKGNIDAWNINAVNIDARNINARNIDAWDINARNINAGNIDAGNIDAWNISAVNIDARNINATNINASFILCESIKQKEGSKLIARHVLTKRSSYESKEQKAIE